MKIFTNRATISARAISLLLGLFSLSDAAISASVGVDGKAIAAESPGANWLSYGRTYSEQRFSPLQEINSKNVGKLGLQWFFDVPDARSLVATPLVKDGVLYFSSSDSHVFAVDARRGKLLWHFDPKVAEAFAKNHPERQRMAWGMSRGVAMWGDRIYVGTADGRLVALSMKTGKEVWSAQATDPASSGAITGAPLAFGGKILIGHGGADNGPVRGYVTAYDAETGKQVWRFYTVPGDPAKGFENDAMKMAASTWSGEWWKHGGGGTVWNSMTYDPEFNRVYIGTGNGAPWNRKIRSPEGGDNLFLCSIVALNADTGEYVWHYQTTPGEMWDYNSAMDMILADLDIGGVSRKVMLHAPKNGFFYVLDRATGKLVSADKIGKVTWADRVDLDTGRPVENPGVRYENGETFIWPGPPGMHNWQPMSFNPETRLTYIPTLQFPGYYNDKGIDPASWEHQNNNARASGVNAAVGDIPAGAGSSSLLAWDPVGKKEVWRVPTAGAWPGGTLATKGNLVFQGQADGQLLAFDANNGKVLWAFDGQRGITAPPIAYRVHGRQYVSVLAGWGGGGALVGGSLFAQHGWTYRDNGRRLLTFALDGKAALPKAGKIKLAPIVVSGFQPDPEKAAQGERLYSQYCQTCHGHDAISGGVTPDLRASAIGASLAGIKSVVLNGALQARGMPRFSNLSDEEAERIYHFIRDRALARNPSPPRILAP